VSKAFRNTSLQQNGWQVSTVANTSTVNATFVSHGTRRGWNVLERAGTMVMPGPNSHDAGAGGLERAATNSHHRTTVVGR